MSRRKREDDADKRYRRPRRSNLYYGGWVAPLQGAQFAGLTTAVGEGAAGDTGTGGDAGGGDGGGV